jgi:hypothetical protein
MLYVKQNSDVTLGLLGGQQLIGQTHFKASEIFTPHQQLTDVSKKSSASTFRA